MQATTTNATTVRLLYRVKEAARQLDVSISQAYNLINRGDLEAVRLGGSLRVPARALEKIARGGNST
jgi:excisionase family DNA binding protein